jgi:nucleoside-diphosphate-sugar epimerase
MHIVVTGGSGVAGPATVSELITAVHTVTGRSSVVRLTSTVHGRGTAGSSRC